MKPDFFYILGTITLIIGILAAFLNIPGLPAIALLATVILICIGVFKGPHPKKIDIPAEPVKPEPAIHSGLNPLCIVIGLLIIVFIYLIPIIPYNYGFGYSFATLAGYMDTCNKPFMSCNGFMAFFFYLAWFFAACFMIAGVVKYRR